MKWMITAVITSMIMTTPTFAATPKIVQTKKACTVSAEVPLRIGKFERPYFQLSFLYSSKGVLEGCGSALEKILEFTLPTNDKELNALRKALPKQLIETYLPRGAGYRFAIWSDTELSASDRKEALSLATLYKQGRDSNELPTAQPVVMAIYLPWRAGKPIVIFDMDKPQTQAAMK